MCTLNLCLSRVPIQITSRIAVAVLTDNISPVMDEVLFISYTFVHVFQNEGA